MFHHQMKHREENRKYDAKRSILEELRGVSSFDETLPLMFDNTSQINDLKMSSFSSDF